MSFLGNLFGGGPSNDQKQSNNLLNSASQTGLNTGGNYLTNSQNAFQAPSSYYASILNGNQGQATGALAPDINRVRGATQQMLQSTTDLAPRGGARSSELFGLPSNEESNVQSIFNVARPAAASALTQIGGAEGGIGANLIGTGVQAANAFGNQAQRQKLLQVEQGNKVGGAIGALLAGPLKGLFSGGSGGGGVNPLDAVSAWAGGG